MRRSRSDRESDQGVLQESCVVEKNVVRKNQWGVGRMIDGRRNKRMNQRVVTNGCRLVNQKYRTQQTFVEFLYLCNITQD